MTLAWVSLAFLVGVVLGSVQAAVWPAIVVATVAAVVIAWRMTRNAICAIVLAIFVLGLWRSPHLSASYPPGEIGHYAGSHVQVTGVVEGEPDVQDRQISYRLSAISIKQGAVQKPVSGTVALILPRSLALSDGDRVQVEGRLKPPRRYPGLLGGPPHSVSGVEAELSYPRVAQVGHEAGGIFGWVTPLRQYLEHGIDSWLPEPTASLLIAITLGARSTSLGDLTPVFVDTGLIHIVAISGIKVALVAGSLYEIALIARRRYAALVVSLIGLWGYVLLTGATVSGVRSAIMWTLVFVANLLGRRTVAIVSLGLAAAVMVALDPTLPWDIGFLLSTVGTFAIVVYTPIILTAVRHFPPLVKEAFAVTVAAQIGTLPVVVAGFHVVSVTGPVANALVLPVLPILIAMGFFLGLAAGAPVLAAPLAGFAGALLNLVVWIATTLDRLPLSVPPPVTGAWAASLYYSVYIVLSARVLRLTHGVPQRSDSWRERDLMLVLAIGCAALTINMVSLSNHPTQLTWLGSGQSWLLTSQGRTMLIDGSPHPRELLAALGTELPARDREIDTLVVTDPRPSNVLGLQEVMLRYRIGEVLDTGVEYPSAAYAAWRQTLQRAGLRAYSLRAGTSMWLGSIRVSIVAPKTVRPNPVDAAGIIRFEGPHRSIVLAGTASEEEQLETVILGSMAHADVLATESQDGVLTVFRRAVSARMTVRADLSGLNPGRPQLLPGKKWSITL